MPEVIDLAQFPRLSCRRCGLVTLVDPALPFDVRADLSCPNCRRPLFAGLGGLPDAGIGLQRNLLGSGDGAARAKAPVPPIPGTSRNGGVPSHAAVGLALAGLMMLLLVGLFVFMAVTPHHSYWQYLTR